MYDIVLRTIVTSTSPSGNEIFETTPIPLCVSLALFVPVQFLEDADEVARDLDSVTAQARQPLHGLPVSVKECYEVKGCQSTTGG